MLTTIEHLAQFTTSFKYSTISEELLQKAKYCFIDTFAVIIKGSKHINTIKMADCFLGMYAQGKSLEWIKNTFTSSANATFLNVYASHVYDYDDTCYAGMTHPSAMIVPAILAVAQEQNVAGKELIAALIIGWEVTGRMGLILPELFSYGWLSGSHFGSLGVVAAISYILGLSHEETVNAFAIALCSIGCIRECNGTASKPYAFAISAKNAVLACYAAKAGLTGSANMLDGEKGYFAVVGKKAQNLDILQTMGKPFILDSPGVCVKKYPVCSSAHAAIQAAEEASLQIKSIEEIDFITCETTDTVLQFLTINNPQTELEAQFCLSYLCCATLVNGTFDAKKHLSKESIQESKIQQLMQKFSIVISASINEATNPEASQLFINKKNGSVINILVNEAKGFPNNPFSKEDYFQKFETCLQEKYDRNNCEICFNQLLHLEKLSSIYDILTN